MQYVADSVGALGEMWSEKILKSARPGQLLAAGWASGEELEASSRAWSQLNRRRVMAPHLPLLLRMRNMAITRTTANHWR